MIDAEAVAPPNSFLNSEQIAATLSQGLSARFDGAKVLILIPDHTRTLPLPQLFRMLVKELHTVKQLDFMVALGTHPPLSEDRLNRLVGISKEERETTYRHIGLFNHVWDDSAALLEIGVLSQEQIKAIAGDVWHPSLGGDMPVTINRRIQEYDQIIILGPTFPHEVAGFSGGAKYLFPGISGREIIGVSHWLGALVGVMDMIGIKDTPVREMLHTAAAFVPVPVLLIGMVVVGEDIAGMFIGDLIAAWNAAADLSAERHILWFDEPFTQVLSWAPPMYDDLWTAAKAMYKLEPVTADGGEILVYAPHLKVVSPVHGKYIYQIGYHVLPYFLKQWDAFKDYPLGVLAHSTHLRGAGRYENGVEMPRIAVTLASQIPQADCKQLALGYKNPDNIDIDQWKNREDDGVLFVPKAGEMLYRLKNQK